MDLQAPGPTPNPGNIEGFDEVMSDLESVLTRLRKQWNPSDKLVTAIRLLESGKLWLQEASKSNKEDPT